MPSWDVLMMFRKILNSKTNQFPPRLESGSMTSYRPHKHRCAVTLWWNIIEYLPLNEPDELICIEGAKLVITKQTLRDMQSFFSETVRNQLEFKVVHKAEKKRRFYGETCGKHSKRKSYGIKYLTTIAYFPWRVSKSDYKN